VFESNFGGNFEEAQDDADAGDKVVQGEEKGTKGEWLRYISLVTLTEQANRSRLERVTAAAQTKHKVGFNPEGSVPKPRATTPSRFSLRCQCRD
jgi:hypothetical protein